MGTDSEKAEILHDLAQRLFLDSGLARMLGLSGCGERLLDVAAEVERAAARRAADTPERPRRSTLSAEAARKLLSAGRVPEAFALIAEALEGDPPSQVRDRLLRLRDVARERVSRHPDAPPPRPQQEASRGNGGDGDSSENRIPP